MNLEGLIPIIAGTLIFLVGTGAISLNAKDPAKMEAWRSKYGKIIKILGPLVILFGFLQLFGILK